MAAPNEDMREIARLVEAGCTQSPLTLSGLRSA